MKEGEARENAEFTIGELTRDAISAAERAIERVVRLIDGNVPGGARSHLDLLDRALSGQRGGCPAILAPTRTRLL